MSGCKFLFMADHHVVDVSDARDAAEQEFPRSDLPAELIRP